MKHPLKGIFIDFDGTLVDSLQGLYQVYFHFLKTYNVKGTKEEFTELNGPSLSEIMETLIHRYHLPHSAEKLLEQYQSLLIDYYREAKPVTGAMEFLKEFKKRGVTLVLVTSADRHLVDPFLERHQLTHLFQEIITAQGLKKSKPDPAIYLSALSKTNLDASQVIAVEDSKNGVQAALNAHIFTFCLNPRVKTTHRHEGWIEVPSWEHIAEELKHNDK